MLTHFTIYSPKIERENIPARVTKVGYNVYPIPNRTDYHVHPDVTEIVFIYSGEGNIYIEGKKYVATTGDFVLYGPGTRHMEDWYISQDALILLYLQLERNVFAIGDKDGQRAIDDMPVLSAGADKMEVSRLLWTLNREWVCGQKYSELICEHLADSLLLIIRRLYARKFPVLVREETTLAEQVRKYLVNHYTQKVTLEILSQNFHVSLYHLSHVFRKEVGISPIHYVNQLRIEQAKRMIRTTMYSVREIVERTGFESIPNFNHMFKKYTGMTPTQYRQAETVLQPLLGYSAVKENNDGK